MCVCNFLCFLWEKNYSINSSSVAVDDQQQEVKAEQAPAPVKKEAPIVAETKVLDGATPSATSGKKKNSAKKQKTEPGNGDKLYLLKLSG